MIGHMVIPSVFATVLNFILMPVMVLGSLYLGYVSIKKWLGEEFNHEQIFLWGASFFILGSTFLLYMVNALLVLPEGSSLVTHTWTTIALWFQAYAVLSIYSSTPSQSRKLRVIMWSLFLFCLTAAMIVATAFNCFFITGASGVFGLQVMGCGPLDYFFEIAHSLMTFIIVCALLKVRNIRFEYFRLWYAYLILVLSELTQIVNMVFYDYTNVLLFEAEWITVFTAVVIIITAVYKLIDNQK